jgi:hypothetical protein
MIALIVLLTACGPAPTSEPPAALATTAPPSPSVPPTSIEQPGPTPVPLPTLPSLPEGPLSPNGPWLLIPADDGLWAVNPDGSGLTHLFDMLSLLSPDLAGCPDCPFYRVFAAPVGGCVAIVEVDAAYPEYPPRLYLLTLPGGEPRVVTELIPTMEVFGSRFQAYYEDVWAAVGVWNQLAWSPDGRSLAFNGAMDGPSADLYLYDPAAERTTRLAADTQSVDPAWSPDGRFIVHGAAGSIHWGASGGGDPTMAGVWAAEPSEGGVRLLFVSEVTAREEILGWVSESTYLGDTCYHGYDEHCENLRTVDVVTGEVESVFPGSHLGGAYDPAARTLLISVVGDLYPAPDLEAGLYLVPATGGDPTPIPGLVPQRGDTLFWSDRAGGFLLNMADGLFAVRPTGEMIPIGPPAPEDQLALDVACNGTTCAAVREDGSLWVGTMGQELTRLWIGSVHDPTWSPDGQHLFFFDELGDVSALYVAQAPDLRPILPVTASIIYRPRAPAPVWVSP